MISRIRAALCAVVLIFIVCSCAFAQFETSGRARFGLRMLDYRPSSGALKKLAANWLAPAADYNFKFDSHDRPTQIFSVGMFSQENATSNAKVLPVTFTVIRHLTKGDETKGWYRGVGLGLYKCEFNTYDFQNGTWAASSGTKVGLSLVGGYDFNEVWFVEARYDIVGSLSNSAVGNVNFGGIFISAGTHVGD